MVIKAFIIGFLGGAITGIPIGPVNIAVIDSATRHHLQRAIAIALGGAVADLAYALIGILWFGPLVKANAYIPPILYSLTGVALIAYGLFTARTNRGDPSKISSEDNENQPYFWSGFGLGIALILLSPATLLAWVVFFGTWMSDVERASGIAASIGVGVGSFVWFSFVAHLANRGRDFLQKKAHLIGRTLGLFLVCFGIFSIGRAIYLLAKLI